MFTPQRKGVLSFTPRTGEKNGPVQSRSGSVFGKGKGVAGADGVLPPPPPDLLGETGVNGGGSTREADTWRRFREAGMLDEASLERRDRDALLEKVEKLQDELYDYQYNMGLLLIEKKEWTLKYEQLQQGLAETEEILKREQASHLNAVSQIEKREENLRNALNVEKQCVANLEKAVHEMRAEHADLKFTSDQKLAEAHALMEKVEGKSVDLETKLRSADARLAEITRKSSELERKSLEFASRESTLLREHASFSRDKELQMEDLAQHREELLVWERNLKDGQERLVESQTLLNQREKKVNGSEKILMNKERELEASREALEKARISLGEKEDYINLRLPALVAKEKEHESQLAILEKKEKDLRDLEENLDSREKVEIQKLLDNHNSILDSKRLEFEKELQERKGSLERELMTKLAVVEKKEKEIKQKEEKLLKKEQNLENKMEKLKGDGKDLDVKAKALKTCEATLKADSLELDKKRKELTEDNQHLLSFKEEIETKRITLETAKVNLVAEQEKLKVTEEERSEHEKLQSKLKQEIHDYRIMKESLLRELEDLRQDREQFEKQWEELDERKSALAVAEQHVSAEKERSEKWKHDQELKLKNEEQVAKQLIQRELNDIRLEKEAFTDSMAHERSEVLEMVQRERVDMARDHDLRKHEIEIDLKKRHDELENQYNRKEAELSERIATESNHVKSLKDFVTLEMQKIKVEQSRFEREKEDYIIQRKKLEEDQLEIHNDIDTLRTLSKNLKDQREEFIKERERFLSLVEQCRSCRGCGVTIELPLPGVRPLHEIVDPENALLPTLSEGYFEDRVKVNKIDGSPVGTRSQTGASSGRMSWLRSCTKKIFKFSPSTRVENSTSSPAENSISFGSKSDGAAADDDVNDTDMLQSIQSDDYVEIATNSERFDDGIKAPDESVRIGDDSADKNQIDLEIAETSERLHDAKIKYDQSAKIGNDSADKNQTGFENAIAELERGGTGSSLADQNEVTTLLPLPEVDSQLPAPKQEVRRRGRANIIKRTHSVQAVVEESKAFLKETSEKDESEKTRKSSPNNKSQGGPFHVGLRNTSVRQKRQYSQAAGAAVSEVNADSEGHSESVSLGGSRKKIKKDGSQAPTAGDKRYNLRRTTVAGTAVTPPKPRKGVKTRNKSNLPVNGQSHGVPAESEESSKHEPAGCPPLGIRGEKEKIILQRCTTESIMEVEKFSSLQAGEEQLHIGRGMGLREASNEVDVAQGDDYETEEGEEENYELDSEKRNTSIGKKLWNFLTS